MPNPPLPPSRRTAPLRAFFATESSGAVLLLVAAVAALVWANSPWRHTYDSLMSADLGPTTGSWWPHLDVRGWIGDGLMSVFFLVAGLEIKRELTSGELATWRRAALPAVAAVGGMVVPALLFVAATAGTADSGAWGIPMATDIALAVGILSALSDRVPAPAKVFLLALAIVDDIGAIVVIAVVYSSGVRWSYLAVAVVCGAIVAGLATTRPDWTPAFVLLGLAMWWCTHEAGVHPTLAGVAMGLLTPTSTDAANPVSRLERLELTLHPWTGAVIVPLFAFANLGVHVDGATASEALGSRLTLGVVLGLVVGKPLGIAAAVAIGRRLGLTLPDGLTTRTVVGLGLIGGVGFTVSILIADLALDDAAIAKLAVLAASAAAAALGAATLVRARPAPTPR